MRYNIDDVRNKLKENYQALAKEYQKEVNSSFQKRVNNMQPGQAVPEKKLTDMESKAFRMRVRAYRQRAESIIADAKAQIIADVTKAPSMDAVNYISLLSKREHISPVEVEFAAQTYGQNYAAYAVISEIATANKIYHLGSHPTLEAMSAVQICEDSNKYYTLETLSNTNHSLDMTVNLYAADVDGLGIKALESNMDEVAQETAEAMEPAAE